MSITLDSEHYFEGDMLQMFLFHKKHIIACCRNLAGIEHSYKSLTSISSSDMAEMVAKDKLIEAEITSLYLHKMITKVDLGDRYFIVFEKGDAFALEQSRPQRLDMSKNYGYFNSWHLHLAVIAFKNRVLCNCTAQSKDEVIAVLDAIMARIKVAFSTVELVDQGKPAINPARDVKYVKYEAKAAGGGHTTFHGRRKL